MKIEMQFFRELLSLIYQAVLIILSFFFYGVFVCIWAVTFPLYWIIRLIKSIYAKDSKVTKTVVVTGAGSGMGQMISVQYAKQNVSI